MKIDYEIDYMYHEAWISFYTFIRVYENVSETLEKDKTIEIKLIAVEVKDVFLSG